MVLPTVFSLSLAFSHAFFNRREKGVCATVKLGVARPGPR